MARLLDAKATLPSGETEEAKACVCVHACTHTHMRVHTHRHKCTPRDAGDGRRESPRWQRGELCTCWSLCTRSHMDTGGQGSNQPRPGLLLVSSPLRKLATLRLTPDCRIFPALPRPAPNHSHEGETIRPETGWTKWSDQLVPSKVCVPLRGLGHCRTGW